MGIVRWSNSKEKHHTNRFFKSGKREERCFSESPKIRRDSDGDLVRQDVGLATTDFFKMLVSGNQKSQNEALGTLDPIRKKQMYKKLASQKHFMMPLEMKQLKNALQKEDHLKGGQSEFLIQDFSRIEGKNPE